MNVEITQMNFIAEIKHKVRNAQYEALKVVNTQLINLYWEIGKSIAEKQNKIGAKQLCQLCLKNFKMNSPELVGFLPLIYG